MVSGHGPTNPQVMLVADFAQGEDNKTGYALSGFKETKLREFSKNAGLNYEDFYRTCLIKDELPRIENWKGKRKASEIELARFYNGKVVPSYADILKKEIEGLSPNLVIPLGEISFQHLTGLVSIRKFRGSVLRINPLLGLEKYTKILPILGPYPYLYSDVKQTFITALDFQKIVKWRDERPIPDDTYQIWIARSFDALRNFIERAYPLCAARSIEEGGYLVFDIETYLNIPTCISFCFDGFESCCIPFLDPSIDQGQRMLMWDLIAKVLASDLPKVNQNVKYDWKTMERWGFRVVNVVGDTMLAAGTLYCEFPKNLGFLTSIYTDLPYFKDEGRQFDPTRHKKDQFYLYNAKDSLSTHQIYSKQIIETKELEVDFVYRKLVQLIPIYRRMEDRGIRIDEQQRQKLLAKYESLFRIHTSMLRTLVNDDELNPLSSIQMIQLVFERLKYNRIRGVKGSDEESLNMLMCFGTPEGCTVERGKQILKEISYCRKLHKVIEILELDLYPDGHFRCEFNLAGTETGRTSAGKTTDYFIKDKVTKTGKQSTFTVNLGHSLQTIGKHGFWMGGELYGTDIRSMFVPSFGYSFVEIDLSGAEARVDRVLSGNFDMSIFVDPPGIHRLTGSWIYKCKPEEINKKTPRYTLVKIARHAAERNMQANRFFMMAQDEGSGLSLTLKEADIFLTTLHGLQPEIRGVFHRDIRAAISGTRCLIAPNGRRRDFFEIRDRAALDKHILDEGISFLPQAIVSDQTKFSFIKTFQQTPWAYLLAESHDSGFAEVPSGREEEYARIYKKNIEVPIDFRKGSLKRDYELVIPCECSKGQNWEEMEEFQCQIS